MPRIGKAPKRSLLAKFFGGNHEMIKEFEKLYDTDDDEQDQIDLIREELDRVEAGAGLETDGTYIVPTGTNFLNSSTSLANADLKLDSALGEAVEDITNLQETIITITGNLTALNQSQLILADATSGVITVTLPDPTTFIIDNVSKKIGITKIDTSNNIINIVPFGSELIVGESSQDLQLQGEVLNFITDGISWHLGA